MITRKALTLFLPKTHRCLLGPQFSRHLHRASTTPIPSPTPFVPNVSTFLSLIGRNLTQHTAKIPNWRSLFSLTSTQLRDLGVEPARTRRYLLWWRDRYRKGVFGIGGDLKNVKDGLAEVRVVEVPVSLGEARSLLPKTRRIIVNEPPEAMEQKPLLEQLKPVNMMKVKGARTIVGPFVQPVKGTSGSVATIKVQEGMWEVKRGEKVDGGERRKVQVRRKRLLEERRTTRK